MMSKKSRALSSLSAHASVVAIVTLALLAFGHLAVTPSAANASSPNLATVVRCDPETAVGIIGEADVVVDMYVQDVVGLYGLDLRLTFDPSLAQVVDKGSGPGVQIEPLSSFLLPDFIAKNSADHTTGLIRYAVTETGDSQPVTGSGPVARMTFHGLKPGTMTMTWPIVELTDKDGGFIVAGTQACTVRFEGPLAVTLASFTVESQPNALVAHWETVFEVEHAGFNLLRSESAEGPWKRLNTVLITGRAPGSSEGAAYSWTDEQAARGVRYFYLLEDVDLHGNTTRHGPVSAELASPNAVATRNLSAGAGLSPLVLAGALAALAALAAGAWRVRRR